MFPEPRHRFIETLVDAAHYTFDQLRADLETGHRIIGTVFTECSAFYRVGASEAMKVVGEVEFVRGVAAQSASRLYGDPRACAAIAGHADLLLGHGAAPLPDPLQAPAHDRSARPPPPA